MAMNTAPVFTRTPYNPSCVLAAANTARDGSGTLVLLGTVPTDGALAIKIIFTSAQATAAASALKVMRIFVTDSAGANPRLRGEILLPLITASNTVIGATATFTFTDGLPLEAGQLIYVTQSIYGSAADQTHVFLEAGKYAA